MMKRKWAKIFFILAVAGVVSSCSSPSSTKKKDEPSPPQGCVPAPQKKCITLLGTARSYMGLFTGLAIEDDRNGIEYAVVQGSTAIYKNCNLHNNCRGEFTICPVVGDRIHNRENVCLDSFRIHKVTPTGQ